MGRGSDRRGMPGNRLGLATSRLHLVPCAVFLVTQLISHCRLLVKFPDTYVHLSWAIIGVIIVMLALCGATALTRWRFLAEADDQGVSRRKLWHARTVRWSQAAGHRVEHDRLGLPIRCLIVGDHGEQLLDVPLGWVPPPESERFLAFVEANIRARGHAELLSARAPEGSGLEPEAAPAPTGRGTEPEAAAAPETTPARRPGEQARAGTRPRT